MAACRHDNLIEVLHAEITVDGPALVMEYLADGSVAAKYGDMPAPVKDVVDIAVQACWGLHRLHLEGLTHRDIKPGNLLLDGAVVKLGDFGLAGRAQDPADMIYAAHKPPEVSLGGIWTDAADLYALGVTAWRLLWGDASNGRRTHEFYQLVTAGQWPRRGDWPLHIHKRLRRALRAAMSPEPEGRPKSAAEFRGHLERARPLVSWVPSGPLEWSGHQSGRAWSVRVVATGSTFAVETIRDSGSGNRRVGAGCESGLRRQDAMRAAREILEHLATEGSL